MMVSKFSQIQEKTLPTQEDIKGGKEKKKAPNYAEVPP